MKPRSAGFTLLEVLVATALLALLGLALLGLVRTTASLSADIRERLAGAADLDAARRLMAERIGRALPVRFATANGTALAFRGGTRSVRLLTAEPPYSRLAGLAAWEFAFADTGDGTLVRVRVAPAAPVGDPFRALEESPWRRLAVFAGRLRLAYLDGPGGDGSPRWVREWERRTDPPRALRIAAEGGGWPPLIVPLRIPEIGGCAGEATGAPACPS